MITLDIEQGTEEWSKARLGIPTASCFDKIVTTKGEPSKQAQKYMWQLAAEKITGMSEDGFRSGWTQRGNDVEAEAREFYELLNNCEVQRVGVCYRNEDKKFSCSPDGLIGEDGGLEIKCPSASVHIGYLLDGKLPTEYFTQVQGNLFITGRQWWDFVSYSPGIKPLIVRVSPDKEFISKLATSLDNFCNELEKITERLR